MAHECTDQTSRLGRREFGLHAGWADRCVFEYVWDSTCADTRNIQKSNRLQKGWDRRLGGGAQRPNREIVSFRSCVRAVIVKWKWASNVIRGFFLFPFGLGRLSLFPWDPPPPPKLLSSFSWLYRYWNSLYQRFDTNSVPSASLAGSRGLMDI